MAHGGEFAPGSKLVTLALAIVFASPAINAQIMLECSSGFVYCLDGMLVCEPNRILCIDGRLVCASKFAKHRCSLGLLNTTSTEPPHHTHQPSSSHVGSNWTSYMTAETESPTFESPESTPSEVGGVKTSSSDVWSNWTSSRTADTEFPTFESPEPTPSEADEVKTSSSEVGSNWTSYMTAETESPTFESPESTPSEVGGVKTSSSEVESNWTSYMTAETESPTFESPESTPSEVGGVKTSSSEVESNWTSYMTAETESLTFESPESTPSEADEVKTSSSEVESNWTSYMTAETESPTFESPESTPSEVGGVKTSSSEVGSNWTSYTTAETESPTFESPESTPSEGSSSSEAYPTRLSLKPVTEHRWPWVEEIHLQMKTRFLRLFAATLASRGITLRNLRFSYVDNHHPGVRVNAKTVRGIFSGGRPELSLLGAKFTQNALDYILQLGILVKVPGEVTAKLQFKYTNRYITARMPIRVKIGYMKFLATVAVKKATGRGSWVGLKATTILIQKYDVTPGADYWILKKMGRPAVSQLVKEMMKTKFVEDSLTFYLTKQWMHMAFPVSYVRG